MPQPHLKVVGIVGRRNLHHTGTEVPIHIGVGNDGYLTVHQRKEDGFSDEMLISFVLRMHCHSCIAQHGLRPCGGNGHPLLTALYGISNIPEPALLLFVFHFRIGKGGFALGTPVDNAVSLINQSFLIQADEHLGDCLAAAFVQGEAFPGPVAGRSQLFQLINNPSAVSVLPFPCPFQKAIPAHIILRESFFCQLCNDFCLRGNAGVIGAGHPQRTVSLHALPAYQNILPGIVQRMAHMKLARNIRRRDHNTERFLVFIRLRMKISFFRPFLIDPILHLAGIIGFCNIPGPSFHFFAHNDTPSSLNFITRSKNKKAPPQRTKSVSWYHLSFRQASKIARQTLWPCNGSTRNDLQGINIPSVKKLKSDVPYCLLPGTFQPLSSLLCGKTNMYSSFSLPLFSLLL